jgi:hypothetical protein
LALESNKDEKAIAEWDENLLLQRLSESFKKAHDKGQKHIAVADFHSHFQEIGLDTITQILNKNGVQKGIIEIDSNIIRPTPLGIEKFKQIDSSFQW